MPKLIIGAEVRSPVVQYIRYQSSSFPFVEIHFGHYVRKHNDVEIIELAKFLKSRGLMNRVTEGQSASNSSESSFNSS